MRVTEVFRNAQFLAEFAALQPQKVEYFRHNHPDFVPQKWWNYQPTDSDGKALSRKLWQMNQEWLREAWQKYFEIGQFEIMRILTSVFDPDNLFDVIWPNRTRSRPTFATIDDMPEELYPYQEAVLYLREQNWRAALCERCKTLFVSAHNRQKYCGRVLNVEGETCFTLTRKEQKRADHAKHRRARNKRRRKSYTSSR